MRPVVIALGLIAFALVATLNTGGYRYGVADQAFYIPAVLRQLDPSLFPRDGTLIASQARLLVFDEVVAYMTRWLDISTLFALGYVVTVGLLFAAYVALARSFYASAWTVAAFVAAMTMKHRIAKTGVNTFEGYFHPRMLAFAIGLFAVHAVYRRRAWAAVTLCAVAAIVHPTTALWFATWVGVALAINERSWRMPLVAMGLLAAAGTIGVWLMGLVELHTMDAEWIAVVSDRDYLFPDEWAFSTWTLNLLYPVVIGLTYRARVRAGVASQAERGVVFGCLALVAVFLCALPFIATRLSVAVQLQVSRVFWMTDVMATLLLIWWLAEAPLARVAQASRLGQRGVGWHRRAMLLAGLIAILALARGVYVQRVEHAGRPLVQVQLPDDAWSDVSGWLQRTPVDSHVLADPGHAWRYGSSLRVSAHRDVFLEDVKDGSIAMYTRPVAMRVAERRAALGDAGTLSENAIRRLAARYDLDYLVSERAFALPEVYRNPRFHVYRLDGAVPAASH